MTRLLIIVIVTLGLASSSVLTVLAQEPVAWVDEAWDGVTIEEGAAPMDPLDAFLGSSGSLRKRIERGHLVTFVNSDATQHPEKPHAHIPEVPDAEFMFVYIKEGEFALDVMPPTSFVVDPAGGRSVALLDVSGDAYEAYYSLPDDPQHLQNAKDQTCTEMCTVPPAWEDGFQRRADERAAIQLLPGDWIVAPAGGICVWCLLNHWGASGPTGQLYVYPLDDADFSWSSAKTEFQAIKAQATPSARASNADQRASTSPESLTQAMGWAFLSPAPNCRSG